MIKGFLTQKGNSRFVGATEKRGPLPSDLYQGPVADITYDKDWLHIQTDPYEGHVMLNVESLPQLIKALSQIAKERGANRA